jgi:hypothetical protein
MADGCLRWIYFTDNTREDYFTSLRTIIRQLPPDHFLLTHDAYIVNMKHVLAYWPIGLGFELYLSNKHIATVSRWHRDEFLCLLAGFPHIKPLDSEDDLTVVKFNSD